MREEYVRSLCVFPFYRMTPRYIIRLIGEPPRYIGIDLGEVSDRKLALLDTYEVMLAKVQKRFGASAWPAHAVLEEVPYAEMFAHYGRLGAKKRTMPKDMPGKLRVKRGLHIWSGEIGGKKTYLCAHSLNHAIEMLAKIGVHLTYGQIYRYVKPRKNFHFDTKLAPELGIWRKISGEWRKIYERIGE